MAVKKDSITYALIVSEIKKKHFMPIYVLMGEESYYIDDIQEKLVSSVLNDDERDFNLTVVYGMDADARDVISVCKRYPVMSKYQVVVVREAQNLGDLDMLQYYAQKPLSSTILIICNKNGNMKAPEFIKTLKANNTGVVFESRKITDIGVSKAIGDYVLDQGCKIDVKAVAMMKDFVGADVARLVGELDKLIILVEDNRTITPELIERNIGISKDYNNFELENAIRSRNAAKAYDIIDYFEKNSKKNPTVLTISILFSFFSTLLLANTSKDKSESGIMAQIDAKSPYRARVFIDSMRNYSTASCVNIISLLREFDTKSKGINSRQNEYDLLHELIFKIIHA